MDQEVADEDAFSGYDSPRGGHRCNTGGSGGNHPARVATPEALVIWVIVTPHPMVILTPPFLILEKFLGRHKCDWNKVRKDKYHMGYCEFADYLLKEFKGKTSLPRPKKPEKLGVELFKANCSDTQRLIEDCEIMLDDFRESLCKDWDRVSLVISLLQGTAKQE